LWDTFHEYLNIHKLIDIIILLDYFWKNSIF
jgi:hypothetical protein